MLALASGEIESRLAAEPAWFALRRLDEHSGDGHHAGSAEPPDPRSRLTAEIDQKVPEWRLLAGIKAAIAALDAALEGRAHAQEGPRPPAMAPRPATQPPPLPTRAKPPPLSTPAKPPLAAWPREARDDHPTDRRSLVERLRLSEGARVGAEPAGRRRKSRKRATAPATESPAPAQSTDPAGEAQDGLARMVALETEVERLLKSGALRRGGPSIGSPGGAGQSGIAALEPGNGPSFIEEAEVEIVNLSAPEGPGAAEPATLAQRSELIEEGGTGETELTVSRQSHLDEASVEIVILDGSTDDANSADPPPGPAKS
jgi:hypothetical protein